MADGPSTETSLSEVAAVEPLVSAAPPATTPITSASPIAATQPVAVTPSEAPSQVVNDVLASVQHVVAAGETVETIANQYNVGADDLRAANQLTADDLLSVGMTLVIPVTAPASTESSDPAGAEAIPETPASQRAANEAFTAPDASGTASEQVAPPTLQTAPSTEPAPPVDAQPTPTAQTGYQTLPPVSQAAPAYRVTPPSFQVGQPIAPLVPTPSSP